MPVYRTVDVSCGVGMPVMMPMLHLPINHRTVSTDGAPHAHDLVCARRYVKTTVREISVTNGAIAYGKQQPHWQYPPSDMGQRYQAQAKVKYVKCYLEMRHDVAVDL